MCNVSVSQLSICGMSGRAPDQVEPREKSLDRAFIFYLCFGQVSHFQNVMSIFVLILQGSYI